MSVNLSERLRMSYREEVQVGVLKLVCTQAWLPGFHLRGLP